MIIENTCQLRLIFAFNDAKRIEAKNWGGGGAVNIYLQHVVRKVINIYFIRIKFQNIFFQ